MGIATLTACFVNSNRDPKKSQPAKPQEFFYFWQKPEDEVQIAPVIAAAFFELLASKLIPGWVVALAPIEKLRKAKPQSSVSIKGIRALSGDGIFLLLPSIQDGVINARLAFVEDSSCSEVRDVDSGVVCRLRFKECPAPCWIIDGEWVMVDAASIGS
ncbi:hypothetical protein CAL7716_085280 [Calothrix sp. PCC 7716]|nr:hypothetical protein CAL7716_085280 [Calothrix sp. PCC 7716]